MVPFGDMLWVRQIVEIWMDGREASPVFNAQRPTHAEALSHLNWRYVDSRAQLIID
jgi:hypothetical protein